MALVESFRRADSMLQVQLSLRNSHELDEATTQTLYQSIFDNLKGGTLRLQEAVTGTADTVADFFKGLVYSSSSSKAAAPGPAAAAVPRSVSTASTASTSDGGAPTPPGATPAAGRSGTFRVDYQRYPIVGYINLPSALQPFVSLPNLDHVVVVAKPSGDVSGGLDGYRDAVPKPSRSAAPIFAVMDVPGRRVKDKGYLWVEVPLTDIFKLEVGKLASVDDYAALLSKKGRWNFKDRQKKFKAGLTCEYVPLALGDREFVESLWPLYKNTGERNGFTVLTEPEFFDFHLTTPDLSVMLIRDKDTGALVTFCTGVRAGDTLMPMWCGTDYDNEKCRTCSSYFNMLYEYVKIGIADPTINWIDLGASRRSAKTAIGFTGYPVSIYIRCKNSVQEALYSQMMSYYFKPGDLINDP